LLLLTLLICEPQICLTVRCTSKLLANRCSARVVLNVGGVVDREASGVSVVGAVLSAGGVVGKAVEVEFLTRIGVMNIDVAAVKVIDRVLNRPLQVESVNILPLSQTSWLKIITYDIARRRVLCPADTVSKTPAKYLRLTIHKRSIRRQQLVNLEDSHLTAHNIFIHSLDVQIAIGSASHEQQIRICSERDRESAGGMSRSSTHTRDDGSTRPYSSFGGIVVVGIHLAGSRYENGFTVGS
jgi:hypothetical protein